MTNSIPSELSDTELESALVGLVSRERRITVELIGHLAEFDSRRLYLGAGFSSLFTYCCDVLRLSEHEAYNRIEVARVIRKCPHVLEMLREGSLTLTTARLLAPHLTAENQAALLARAGGLRKREVEELLAAEFPRPAVPASIRKLPAPTASGVELPLAKATPKASPAEGSAVARAAAVPVLTPPPIVRRPAVTPLSAEQFLVKFTAAASTREKLRRAQDLLRHAIPSGDIAEIFDRALTVLIGDLERKRFAATDRPRRSGGPAQGSRSIAADVKRGVSARDGERCAFVGRNGRRCNERGFVEFHHVDPYVLDPRSSVDGISLRCQARNKYEATLYFGPWRGRVEEKQSGEGASSP